MVWRGRLVSSRGCHLWCQLCEPAATLSLGPFGTQGKRGGREQERQGDRADPSRTIGRQQAGQNVQNGVQRARGAGAASSQQWAAGSVSTCAIRTWLNQVNLCLIVFGLVGASAGRDRACLIISLEGRMRCRSARELKIPRLG